MSAAALGVFRGEDLKDGSQQWIIVLFATIPKWFMGSRYVSEFQFNKPLDVAAADEWLSSPFK